MKKLTFLLAFIVFGTVFSCKTTKSRTEELSGIKKLYHNTTARYNGFFNADVLLNQSIATLEEAHQDNYNKVLPVYEYIDLEPNQTVNKDLDIAIEKVSIVATLHRQSDWTDDCYLLLGKAQYLKQDFESAEETFEYTVKEFSPSALSQRAREANRKKGAKNKKIQAKKSPAQKAKEQEKEDEYEEVKLTRKQQEKQRKKTNKAIKKKKLKDRKAKEKARKRRKKGKKVKAPKTKTEEVKKEEAPKKDPVNKVVKEPKEKKVKKEKDKPENLPENLFKTEKLAFAEIQLWLARTYIEREDFNLAERYINYAEGAGANKEVAEQIDAVKAHLYLKQKRYDSAIPHLEAAINSTKNKEYKARYAYIRAQLAEINKNNSVAADFFSKAIKYSNRYEMEFNGRLAMLKSAYASGAKTMASTSNELERMLKDDKNIEYKDQIYFTLAELNLEAGDKIAAIENFRNSLDTPSRNNAQKTETYLKLAELYFEEETYVEAKLFYDSTYQVMDKTDERYEYVKGYSENLTDIAANLEIIALQDSLLSIIDLDPEEREALALKIRKEEEERNKKGLAANKNSNVSKQGLRDARRQSNIVGPGGRSGASAQQASLPFPLYNEKNRKKGAKEFEKVWGSRDLVDNWRRSNRQQVGEINDQPIAEVEIPDRLTEDEVNKILADIPSGDEEISAANKIIEDAYFDLGRLYRDRLQRNDKTVEALEDELLVRYPETEHKLDAWYYLYLAHTKEGNSVEAKKYFDLIVDNFPNTTYARVLSDPNYLEAAKEEGDKLGRYYEDTYTQFQNKEYEKVISGVDKASEQFGPGNIMMAKFALLKAMSVGNTKGKEDYISQLKDVIAKYPKSPEETRAREILRLLGDKSVVVQPKTATATGDTQQGKFKLEPEALHYVAVVITSKNDQKITDAKVSLANFNKEFFRTDNLRLSNIFLNNDTSKPILVIRKFSNQKKAMTYVNAAKDSGDDFLTTKMEYQVYPLTQANYREVLRNKSFEGYGEFFEENYK